MKRPDLHKWQKRIGDVHIGGRNTTLCGRPMLGNNYAEKDAEITCEECILCQVEKEHGNKQSSTK